VAIEGIRSSSDEFKVPRESSIWLRSSTTCDEPWASSPAEVFKIHGHLQQSMDGSVGLRLGCRGAPADWAGRKELLGEPLGAIQKQLEELGSPQVITARSSCYRMFKDHASAMPVESLWTVLDRVGPPSSAKAASSTVVAIHDACTTRHETDIQDSVRQSRGARQGGQTPDSRWRIC